MANRIAGIAYLKVDGRQYPLRGNFTISPSPVERGMIAGQDYVHGYFERIRTVWIEGDVSLDPALSLDDVEGVINGTVTAELANGNVYTLQEAVCKAAHELNANEGQFRVRFEGVRCNEVLG